MFSYGYSRKKFVWSIAVRIGLKRHCNIDLYILKMRMLIRSWSLHTLHYFSIRVNAVVMGREPLYMRVSIGHVQAGVQNLRGGVRAELVVVDCRHCPIHIYH